MSDQEDTHFGIFWVRAMDGRWVSATPGEACAEIVRLRDALRQIKTSWAGYTINDHEGAFEVADAMWSEILRMDTIARAALAGEGEP